MFKRSMLALIVILISTSSSFADFKYTEEHISKMDMPGMGMMGSGMAGGAMMSGMPPGMMNQMMGAIKQPPADIKTTYIKGTKKRVDEVKHNTSTITICDKKEIIRLNHQNKTYTLQDMTQRLREMEAMCNQQTTQQEFNTEIPKNTHNNNTQEPQENLIIKTTIIDTKEDEMIGSLVTRHYIKTVDISGAPNCTPSMKQTEEIWATNIKPETLECPIFAKFSGCKNMPKLHKMPNNSCFKNAKHINEGLQSIPGFVVKRVMNMDMGSMMQNIGGMQGGMPPMMGSNMKVEDTTIITDMSNNPLPDSLFVIPEGYTLDNSNNRHHRGF